MSFLSVVLCLFTANGHIIVITGTQSGLGIRIVGGQRASPSQESQNQGIFIKEVTPGSLAERDGIYNYYAKAVLIASQAGN